MYPEVKSYEYPEQGKVKQSPEKLLVSGRLTFEYAEQEKVNKSERSLKKD